MRQWTGEGRTAEDAAVRGAAALGLDRKDVEFHILGERSSLLLSLFGFRRVKVRVTEKPGRSRAEGFRHDQPGRREERQGRRDGRRDRQEGRGEGRYERRENSEYEYRSGADFRPDHRRERVDGGRDQQRREGGREKRRDGRAERPRNEGPRGENPRGESRQEFRREQPRQDRDRRDDRNQRGRQNHDNRGERQENPNRGNERQRPPQGARPQEPRPPRENAPRAPETFRPAVAPEVLLAQWKELFAWPDLAWDIQPLQGRRLPIVLKTEQAKRLAGSGRALEAFEFVFNLIASGGDREKPWVTFQLEGFPSADEARAADQAMHAAFQVRRSGRPYRMDPMPSALRRLVHQTLANHPDVETTSEGEGPSRKVVVKPRSTAVAAGPAEAAAPPAADAPPPPEGPAV